MLPLPLATNVPARYRRPHCRRLCLGGHLPDLLSTATACDVDDAPPAYTITLILVQNLRCFSGCYTPSLLSLPRLRGRTALVVAAAAFAASATRHSELEAPSRSSTTSPSSTI
ncbi:hypothetical protein GUJ93_ZPchr0006g43839 [Zizania palustris]|uniref:Uncharacterized protein n=1 Tax=Zizania palustris TaxID=103762 RepID=A0A8J5W511_ZIZPA|nr:hypothetical protein GUJ93_ZPchr0006g43839 [Zizania palustris]